MFHVLTIGWLLRRSTCITIDLVSLQMVDHLGCLDCFDIPWHFADLGAPGVDQGVALHALLVRRQELQLLILLLAF